MSAETITVTKPHVPDKRRFYAYVERALDNRWLTNDGPLVRELKEKLEDYLGVSNILLVGNGTLGILVALKIANCSKVLTTPFSFPATSSAPVWANIGVSYGDICPNTYNLVAPQTQNLNDVDGVLATHVYGNPCDLVAMERLASDWEVPIVYDAAHAFGVKVSGQSILDYGDMSVLSFHATKLFHCGEGGAIRFQREDDYIAAKEMINFGYSTEARIQSVGINAKMNELEAAMGLAVLEEIDSILDAYRANYEFYDELLDDRLKRQRVSDTVDYNYSYFPVLFPDSSSLKTTVEALNKKNIFPRNYFSPSLDTIEVYGVHSRCEVSRDIAARILCLPTYSTLAEADMRRICETVNLAFEKSDC